MKNILVTGGAGYIGSHTAKALAAVGLNPVVFDNLAAGHRWAVRYGAFEEADIADASSLCRVIREYEIDAVVHFAANAYVGESIQQPQKYFRNNVANTLHLLDAMLECGVNRIVFSSTCATYGTPDSLPLTEAHPQRPVNPYGESKLFVERVLRWYGDAYDLRWTALRYFNAAGADPEGELGEEHVPETHLIPLAIFAAIGNGSPVRVFGADYGTSDGTAVRDYIHVRDLARAHVLALQYLAAGEPSGAFNLGTGRGYTVRQVVETIAEISRSRVTVEMASRRPGDADALVADPSRAREVLGWRTEYCELHPIIETALRWHAERSPASRSVSA